MKTKQEKKFLDDAKIHQSMTGELLVKMSKEDPEYFDIIVKKYGIKNLTNIVGLECRQAI